MPEVKDQPCYIGIDPGASGGLVAIIGKVVCSTAMPATEREVWEWVNSKSQPFGYETVAVIEKVGAMPGNGVVSMFKFGCGFGKLLMALTAARIPFEQVPPQTWQKRMGIPPRNKKTESKEDFKRRLKQVAGQLYPHCEVTRMTADALLIATYCQRKHRGTL